ncbi:hypothetical protein HK414_01150 [Ramlibacter terrae]|uniref:MaoC family dehydratase n=1 Tax=Ramlibacter terrae TaxID=2732511 RepID=A0ABX6P1Y9_9BURK|nr:hypothetical protein HK414_01150 [Ramlibacter terrae]
MGDTLHAEVKVLSRKETREPDRGVLTVGITVLNRADQPVLEYQTTVLMRREAPRA